MPQTIYGGQVGSEVLRAGDQITLTVDVGSGAVVERLSGGQVVERAPLPATASFGPYIDDMTFRVSVYPGATVRTSTADQVAARFNDTKQAAGDSLVSGAGENEGLEWKYLAGDLPSWTKGAEWTGGYPISTAEITRSHGMHMRLDGSRLTADSGLISRTGIAPAIDLSGGRLLGILVYAHRLNQGNPGTGIRLRVGTSATNYNYYNWAVQENTLVEGWNWLVIHSLDSGQIRKIQTGVTMAGWQVGAGSYNAATTPATYLAIECTKMRAPNYPILWCSSIFVDGGEKKPRITLGFDITGGYETAESILDANGLRGYLAVGRAQYAETSGHIRLYNKGWDIVGHTGAHTNIGTYAERAQMLSELEIARTQGRALGFTRSINLFASPNGSWSNKSVDALARAGFKWHRAVSNAPVTQYDKSVGLLNPLIQGGFTCGSRTLPDLIATAETLLIRYKANCHFYTHDVVPGGDGTNWPADSNNIYEYTLRGFAEWLSTKQAEGLCQVVTPSEYIRAAGGTEFDPQVAWPVPNSIDIQLAASPSVVENPTNVAVVFAVAGGSVSAVEVTYDGTTYINTGAVGGLFYTAPGCSIRITHTAEPAVKQLRPA